MAGAAGDPAPAIRTPTAVIKEDSVAQATLEVKDRALQPLIEVKNLSFAYADGQPVLDSIDVSIEPGTIVGVVGPSGCGKSTLLSILAGLVQPTGGEVNWAPETGPHRHPISMMFQGDTLLPWLTVKQNVGLHYRLIDRKKRPTAAGQRERVESLINLAGLNGAEDRFPYQLSGGMRRRTSFLAAVTPEPRTLLLDEPFSALDEPTRISIHQDVHDVIKQQRITTLLITHDLAEAISLSDRVLVMTARPASVFRAFDIPFGEKRKMLELREDPEFLRLYGEIWEQLATQIQRSQQGITK
jgi:NitT/TauT family transport system ATP-binding protein